MNQPAPSCDRHIQCTDHADCVHAHPYRPLFVLVDAADERGKLYQEWTTLHQWYGAEYASKLAGRLVELGCLDVSVCAEGEPVLALPIGEWRIFSMFSLTTGTVTRGIMDTGNRVQFDTQQGPRLKMSGT